MSELLFDPKSVQDQQHYLTRMLRLLFTKRRVTSDDFYKQHYQYDAQFNKTQYKIQSDRNNLKKLLRMDNNLTIKSFLFTIVDIMRWDILEFRLVLKDPETQEVFDVSSRDYIDNDGNYVEAPPIETPRK